MITRQVEILLLPEEAAVEKCIREELCRQLSCREEDLPAYRLIRRSVDARKRPVRFLLRFDIYPPGTKEIAENEFQDDFKNCLNAEPVVIAGMGPAGIFAALELLRVGLKPIILERGKDVRSRRRDSALLNKEGIVNPDSNYCFGEGGAGTYSDGKLYTRSSKRGDIKSILNTLVHFGADPSIRIDAHPHIGTNKLPALVSAMRECIESYGGEVHFGSRLLGIDKDSGSLRGIRYQQGETEITMKCRALILATGHSARDVFQLLDREKILIERKPFALGVRVEHPQALIDQIQYRCERRPELLPPASYQLTTQAHSGGVFSFCMCPGGIIAPAATAPGEVVVNGWSPSKRNNAFANSGIVVTVDDEDFRPFRDKGQLSAMYFQADVEKKCFEAGGGQLKAPAQRLVDFTLKRFSADLPACSYHPGLKSTSLHEVLPEKVFSSLQEGFKAFGRKMNGYLTNEALVVATESRTSSPVRIPRDPHSLNHPELRGLIPCGEGAGYAGGIVSAAMDGIKCALAASDYIGSEKDRP